jgi:predicted dehydrogenase
MSNEKVRIGVIGAGGNARAKHLPNFKQIEGVEVLAVCNRRPESTAAVARDFGIPRTCSEWREVIGMPDVDAILIGTWPYLHCEAACAALEAGKHVLCEARMAMNAQEAHRMLETLRASGRVGQLVPGGVGLAGDRVVRELIAGGFVGEPYEVYVRSMSAAYIDPHEPLHWRQDEKLSGMNVLALGIFNETVQRWLGDTTAVLASTRTFIPQRTDPQSGEVRRVGVPDSVAVLAEMACGARAVYHVSGVANAAGEDRIEIYGSAGALHYLVAANHVHGAERGEGELREIPIPPDKVCKWTVERDFIASIRDGRPVTHVSFGDGVKYMEFTEAVHRSAASGAKVPLPLG